MGTGVVAVEKQHLCWPMSPLRLPYDRAYREKNREAKLAYARNMGVNFARETQPRQ